MSKTMIIKFVHEKEATHKVIVSDEYWPYFKKIIRNGIHLLTNGIEVEVLFEEQEVKRND